MSTRPSGAQGGNRKTREVRLEPVMRGGVSLAIYNNGAAHEFFEGLNPITLTTYIIDVAARGRLWPP